jgi:ribosomal protein S12 methylthiotransferase
MNYKIGFISLGCPKALVDSERILTLLRADGYVIADDYAGADMVIVNTCGFIDDAVAESLDAISEALRENGKVIVTGCLGAREHGDFVKTRFPKVLAVTGAAAAAEVHAIVRQHLPMPESPIDLPDTGIKLTPSHYAYLKISEGCNHHCSFCVIPALRGTLVSRPIGEVLTEAEALLKSGVKELLVVSQDTAAYGSDARYQTTFWNGRPLKMRINTLTQALDSLGKKYGAWVRLHYVYPYALVDDLVAQMAESLSDDVGRHFGVLPYLDVPLQHASPKILRAMKRPAAIERTLERVRAWRKVLPQLTLRSTFIVGFPGETDADFDELLDFLRDAQLDRVGAFAYSPVEGAAANALPHQIPEDVKQERLARFMAVQAEVSAERLQQMVGKTVTVLVDQHAIAKRGKQKTTLALARTMKDAPEIDGIVQIIDGEKLPVGSFAEVTVTEATEHDLIAAI